MPKREQKSPAVEPTFEAQLASLEKIVRELERGDLPLEQSLELFEQGVRLSRECQERLNEAERRIEVLLRGGDGSTIAVPFEADELAEDEGETDDERGFGAARPRRLRRARRGSRNRRARPASLDRRRARRGRREARRRR